MVLGAPREFSNITLYYVMGWERLQSGEGVLLSLSYGECRVIVKSIAGGKYTWGYIDLSLAICYPSLLTQCVKESYV